MLQATRSLLDKIIECPSCSSCAACKTILSAQGGNRRQVPEPWSGDLDNAGFLILGSNPALTSSEVFPSKDANWRNWVDMGDLKTPWTSQDAADFFEGRFGVARCPSNGQLYYDPSSGGLLVAQNSTLTAGKPQNNYWEVYNRYCKAIDANYVCWSFVVTDCVHCKSPKEIGVSQAWNACIGYTKSIIQLFAKNCYEGPRSIIIVGRNYGRILKAISSCGAGSGAGTVVGYYNYKRSGKCSRRSVEKTVIKVGGVPIDVYYGIPAPSGSNRASMPVNLLGKDIYW